MKYRLIRSLSHRDPFVSRAAGSLGVMETWCFAQQHFIWGFAGVSNMKRRLLRVGSTASSIIDRIFVFTPAPSYHPPEIRTAGVARSFRTDCGCLRYPFVVGSWPLCQCVQYGDWKLRKRAVRVRFLGGRLILSSPGNE